MHKSLMFFIALFILGCQPKELPTMYKVDKEDSYLKVSHLTTQTELMKIKEGLKTINIDLDFGKSVFFEDGKLRQLVMVVILPDGSIGTCASDLTGLQYKYFGFQYTPTGDRKLRTGSF
jgi:hypothetical protein